MVPISQVIDLSIRLIVMWSVPYNLNLHDTYMGIAMVYNRQLPSTLLKRIFFLWHAKGVKKKFSLVIIAHDEAISLDVSY